MKYLLMSTAIILAGMMTAMTAFGDVKIKTRQTAGGQTTENTTYIKGKRERAEQNLGGMQTVNITQCDLKRSIQLMPQAQTYLINMWDQAANGPTSTTTTKQTSSNEKGGVITVISTVKDTGERKQMFGYSARHLIITTETESSPDACTPIKSKLQTDGWYIDAAFALDCQSEQYKNVSPISNGKSTCRDRYEMKQIGSAKRGYPLYEKFSMFDESGKEINSFTNEVMEISSASLDGALFDVPAGYREVKTTTDLYASAAGRNLPTGTISATSSNISSGARESYGSSKGASAENSSTGPKKEGIVRIGLAQVKTTAAGEGVNPQELSAAVQNSLTEYLKTPGIELVLLDAKLPAAIEAEAKQKECDFVVYTGVAHKKGGGGGFGGMLGKSLGSVVAQTGIGHTGSAAGNIAGQMATQTIVATTLTSNVKSKDEITLDLRLMKGDALAFSRQFKGKAKSDGEDILTPLIEQSAQAIVEAASKK
jgi:hypothetical protein